MAFFGILVKNYQTLVKDGEEQFKTIFGHYKMIINEKNFSQGSNLIKWESNFIRGLIYFSGGQILLTGVKFYFTEVQFLLRVKITFVGVKFY
jgi:uncharacterized protein (DUF39 family)